MRYYEIINERWREIQPYHAPKTEVDQQTKALCAALTDWVCGEHYRLEVQRELAELTTVAAEYKTDAPYLYRGYALHHNDIIDLREKKYFDIATNQEKPFASWTKHSDIAANFMTGYSPWVVFRKATEGLDVYCDVALFDERVKPFTRMRSQQEVIVRMPDTMRVKISDIVKRKLS